MEHHAALTHYLCIGPNVWGIGITEQAAIKKARSIYGSGMKDYNLLHCHPKSSVDDMGYVGYPTGPSEDERFIFKPVLCKKVRKGKEVALDAK